MSGFEIVGMVMTGVSGVMNAMQAMTTAQNKANIATYNQQIAERNEQIALSQAENDQQDKRRQNMRQMGAIRAAYGGSGLDMAGSPLDVLTDTAMEQAYDEDKVRYKGRLRAMGYADRAGQFKAEADFYEAEGTMAVVSSMFNTATKFAGSPMMQRMM
jgi:hypothetical protein